MPSQSNAQLFGNILLHSLDCVVLEFHDLAAMFTDEVIMMMFAGYFEPRLVFIEVAFGQQLAVLQQLERAIDRGVTDMRIYFLDLGV
jgi:hypothetical protein